MDYRQYPTPYYGGKVKQFTLGFFCSGLFQITATTSVTEAGNGNKRLTFPLQEGLTCLYDAMKTVTTRTVTLAK